jgi:hypothetical protein
MHNRLATESFLAFSIVICHNIIYHTVNLCHILLSKTVHDVQQSAVQHTVFHHRILYFITLCQRFLCMFQLLCKTLQSEVHTLSNSVLYKDQMLQQCLSSNVSYYGHARLCAKFLSQS